MPALPTTYEPLSPGMHTVTVISHKSTTSKEYGTQQEEVKLLDVNSNTEHLIWISWGNRKKIDMYAAVGAVKIDEAAQDWQVVDGATFQIVVVAGKVTAAVKPQ